MSVYAEILDARRDPLRTPFATSVLCHVAITAGMLGWSWWENRQRDTFGDPNTIPGSVSVSISDGIPMITRGPKNPVANETESQVPAKPKPVTREREADDPDAVAIGRKKTSKRKQQEVARAVTRKELFPSNQMTSTTGARASSPIFAPTSGGGGVGVGAGNPFGTRFGAYGRIISERIAQKWRTQDLDARLQQAPVAIVSFQILRNGSVNRVRLVQSSGNYAIDSSAQRAVTEASPFPPLPEGFERDSANIEIEFQFKR